MNKYTVISNHEHQVTCDHVFAVNGDAALITVAAARPGAEIIIAMPGHQSDLTFAGEGMVDANQLIENAAGDTDQVDVLRHVLSQEGFEIKQGDNGRFYWTILAGIQVDGPQCETEAEAIVNCFAMNADIQLRFDEDGCLGLMTPNS